jgi:hypothetical protein
MWVYRSFRDFLFGVWRRGCFFLCVLFIGRADRWARVTRLLLLLLAPNGSTDSFETFCLEEWMMILLVRPFSWSKIDGPKFENRAFAKRYLAHSY